MYGPFLIALALFVVQPAYAETRDDDLWARLKLAAAPGTQFAILPAQAGTPQGVRSPACTRPAAGLCDIPFLSAPPAFMPISLPPDWQRAVVFEKAQVLLYSEDGQPLIAISRSQRTVLLAFSLQADALAMPGARLRRWPYFNYLLHVASCAAADVPPPRFANWIHAPLPSTHTRLYFVVGLGIFWGGILLLYRLARYRGARNSEAPTRFLQAVTALRQHSKPSKDKQDPTQAQNAVAFARPLSGLLMLLGGMVLLTGPYFAMQSLITGYVQPFPEADGLWRTTVDALWLAWLTFDLGTQTAFVKYFAEHRVSQPEKALLDVQFYIWFQIFSRTVEMSLLVGFALGYLPGSIYAYYMPFLLLYAATTQPAFNAVGKFLCQAVQRFDYYNLLDFLEFRLLGFLVPLPLTLLGRAWGRQHPEFGEAYGAALGMGFGAAATGLCVLGIGLYALYRLKLPVRLLFLAQFQRDTVRQQLWFGFKLTLGQEPFRLTFFLESIILLRWLRDSPTWLGLRDLLNNRLTMLSLFAWGYYQSVVPVVSEALAGAKHKLLQYYVARYLQFGSLFAGIIFSLLCSVGPIYIRRALGAQWGLAADYLFIAALGGLLHPWAWLSDSLQQGAGRPGTTTLVMLIEQGMRLLLLLLLIQRFQFLSIYLATLLALVLKTGVAWSINSRRIVPLRLPLWTTLGAPHLVALVNFLLWRGVVVVLMPTRPSTVLALFFVAGAVSIGLGFFLLGLFGGLDIAARRELHHAAKMVALIGPLCRALSFLAEFGARLSPFHPEPPMGWQEAAHEAADLEQLAARCSTERVSVKEP